MLEIFGMMLHGVIQFLFGILFSMLANALFIVIGGAVTNNMNGAMRDKERAFCMLCNVVLIMIVFGVGMSDVLTWFSSAIASGIIFASFLACALYNIPGSKKKQVDEHIEPSLDSRSQTIREDTAKTRPILDRLHAIYAKGSNMSADKILNYQTVCEIAESLEKLIDRFSEIEKMLILTEEEYKLLSRKGVGLHHRAGGLFHDVCEKIQLFDAHIWPRMCMAAKRFELADNAEAEQKDFELLQKLQIHLISWNNSLDEVANLVIQMAESALVSENHSSKTGTEFCVESELGECKELLVYLLDALKETNLRSAVKNLGEVFLEISNNTWDGELLTYSLSYLQLIRSAANEYAESGSEDLEVEIGHSLCILNMMWTQMAKNEQCFDILNLKAELNAAANLAHVRGYVPGELKVGEEN